MLEISKNRAEEDTLFAEMRKKSPKVTGGIMRAREAAYAEGGHVPAKYKLLTALAISVAIRCEPCIKSYVKMATDRGATEEDLIAFLNVAMTMQGRPGEEWAIKAYASYKELIAGATVVQSCCSHEAP